MKLTKAQKIRLKALLAELAAAGKTAADITSLSTEKQAEMNVFKGCTDFEDFCKTASAYDPAGDNEGSQMSDDEVRKMVGEELQKALKAAGATADDVVAKIKALPSAPTAEQIREIIKASAPQGVDTNDIVEKVKAALPKTLSKEQEEQITKLFDNALKSQRDKSQMRHSIELPIAHRLGNLTVAQKQLLNLCMMKSGNSDLLEKDRPKHMDEGISDEQLERAKANGAANVKSFQESVKAGGKSITTGGAGTGAEFIDTDISSDLLRRFYMNSPLAAKLIPNEVVMPTDIFKFPMSTTRTQWWYTAETVAAIASDPGTAQPVLTAKKFMGMTSYSYEADEAAIVAILPWLQRMLGEGAAESWEYALVNGDMTNPHMDSDIAAMNARHPAKWINGFRDLTKAITGLWLDIGTGGANAANIATLLGMMGKYGLDPAQCLLLVGTTAYNQLRTIDEVLTVDKMGAGATINTGTLANIYGMEIMPTAAIRQDLGAAGVYASSSSKSVVHIFHKPSVIVGVRKAFTVEVDVDKQAQVNYVIANFRRDFIPKETPSASEPMMVTGYNV